MYVYVYEYYSQEVINLIFAMALFVGNSDIFDYVKLHQ